MNKKITSFVKNVSIVIITTAVVFCCLWTVMGLFAYNKYVEPNINRNEYVTIMGEIANTLGSPERDGYDDGVLWDPNDWEELCKELDISPDTFLEDIPSKTIKEFVEEYKE